MRAMEARIVQTNLQKCYRIEGVNHLEKCQHLADRYTDMLRENRVRLLREPLFNCTADTVRRSRATGTSMCKHVQSI